MLNVEEGTVIGDAKVVRGGMKLLRYTGSEMS